ncbi:hypothetical protein E4656_00405 [Natronospirillum operosum]|uniref:Uncharacterized protein n=1 Tax=Natronospirillum operosum TaxID=2759953 RepID=A0A4Z0WG45_9GAMM|nr:hypothetical protein [Natronospirillum operosum]TGG94927.1 hypothetical protein E4656_00405 [Natronospirillum operosum]
MQVNQTEGAMTAPAEAGTSQLTLALLALAALLAWTLIAPDPWRLVLPERADIQLDDQTYRVSERQWRQAFARSVQALDDAEGVAVQRFEGAIAERVEAAFDTPRNRVEEAADWYYSLPGHSARALSSAGSLWGTDQDQAMAERLQDRLFPPEAWPAENEQLLDDLVGEMALLSQQTLRTLRHHVQQSLAHAQVEQTGSRPVAANIDLASDWQAEHYFLQFLQDDRLLLESSAALSASALGTIAARRGAQMAAARLASRGAAGGMAASGLTACAATGPVAWLCGIGFFAGSLVATEWAILTLDEVRNRDTFEALLEAEINRLQAQYEQHLIIVLTEALRAEFVSRQSLLAQQVRPIDLLFAQP